MEILKESGWNFADGVPVAWLGRRKSGLHGFGCTRGPSTFVQTLHDSVDVACVSHFFIGSSDESLKEMLRVIERDFPGVRVAGAFSPPFGPVSESLIDECEQRIKSSGASLVWVALGTPKQDFFTDVLSRRVNLPCAGVGAAFDFLSGSVKEAPSFLRGTGVEWLYRLAAEPQRLWRRYTFGTARFLFAVARDGGLFSRGSAPEARE
ncbi:WecB/TagA/CpsF family glycosyltransferase [Gordonia sp. 135]|uniref:WecB/TagA/CpsF family glycosyltransferase n=1 Tax=Gordonia sp. 135 TaxID=2676309 RepID=UPI0012BB24CF|nr:WecB/TagA/CpsF family glycosyltransferase [Gordonia sp. 135]QGP87139.1 WecB/TagA/CpsF family glycosyltransferase [Gordonia sp. 135]